MRSAGPAVILGVLLAAGIGLTIYGMASSGILDQRLWTGAALRQLGYGAVAVFAPAGIVFLLAPNRMRLVAVGAGLFIGAIGFGIGPLAAVFYIGVSALTLGEMILGDGLRSKLSPDTSAPIALLIGLAAFILLLGVAMHLPVNYPPVYLIGLALPIVAGRQYVKRHGAAFREWLTDSTSPTSLASFVLWTMVFYIGVLHASGAALPERYNDALAMHLMVPTFVATRGLWSFDFVNYVWAVIPLGADWLYAMSYLLAGEPAAKLINLLFFFLVLWLLLGEAKRDLPPSPALVAVLLMASTPVAFLETNTLFIENALAALIFGSYVLMIRVLPTVGVRAMGAVVLLLAAAISTKVHAIFVAMPLGTVLLVQRLRQTGLTRLLPILAVTGIIVALGLVPYAYAYAVTGNPVFPFFNAVFKSPFYPSSANFDNSFYPGALKLDVLYKMTFFSQRYLESDNGALGFQFIVFGLAGSGAVLIRRQKDLIIALLLSLFYLIAVCANTQYIRYLYPVFPLMVLVCSAALMQPKPTSRYWHGFAIVLAGCVIALNLAFWPSAGWILRDFSFKPNFSTTFRDHMITAQVPQRNLNTIINETHGEKAVIAYFGTPVGADLKGKPLFFNWYNLAFYTAFAGSNTIAALEQLFRKRGITHVVLPVDTKLENQLVFGEFLKQYGRIVAAFPNIVLYRIEVPAGPAQN